MCNLELIISDLDGTLLNEHHTLSEETKKAVKTAQDKEIPFWVATGRHHLDAKEVVKSLGLETYVIAANGGTILNPDGSIYAQEVIPKHVVQGILAIDYGEEVLRNLYQEDLWLMERADDVFKDYYSANDFKYTLCQFDDYLNKPINKVFFTSLNPDALIPIAHAVKVKFSREVDVTFSLPMCLEIMPKHTNKGAAIKKLANDHAINLKNTMAFGDGLNDLEMLQTVGLPHVMANALDALKAQVKNAIHIGKNSDHAVAKTIEAALAKLG